MTTIFAPKTADDVAEPLAAVVTSLWNRHCSRLGSLLTLLLLLVLGILLLHGAHRVTWPRRASHMHVVHSAKSPILPAIDVNPIDAQQQLQQQQQRVNSAAGAGAAELSIVSPESAAAIAAADALAGEPSASSAGPGDRLGESVTGLQRAADGGERRLVVLFWTTFWRDSFEVYLKESDLPPSSRCSRRCELAYDKQRLREADVVLFHAPDLGAKMLPNARSADQLWVLFSIEAPPHGYVNSAHDGVFNLTMTYRSDADIEVGYGHTEAIVATAATAPPLPSSIANAAEFAKRKPYAYWIASNCAESRMAYVRELAEHIRVDVFGRCGPPQARPCPSSNSAAPDGQCVEELSATYAFYLAFENSLCTDYITEKLWRTLVSSGGSIPVVIGAQPSRYEKVAPPGSFVHAESFASPRDLAAHLTRIASSHELFISHHLWRTSYKAHVGWDKEFALGVCRLCESIHDRVLRPPRPAKPDLYSWFSAGCRSQWPLGRR